MSAQKDSSSLWIGFVVILFVLADFAAAQPEPFLLAWWKFDDGGGPIAEDSAGTNHAMVEGPVWTTGVINGALAFNGMGDCVRPGFSPELDDLAVHDFTIAMWISTSNASQSILIGNYMEPFLPSWNFEIFYGGVLRLYLDGEDHFDDVSVADGNWHHVAALRQVGYHVKLYIDGQESYSGFSAKEPYVTSGPTLIGMDNRMEPVFFGGVMDDVRIYDIALAPDQIERLAGIAAWPSPTDGAGMISVDTQLSWTAGVGVLSHDVYLGTDNPPTTLIADDILDSNCFPDTLDCSTLYHWRVDENTSAHTITGDAWSFTTIDGKATAPQPTNGASGVSVNTDLSWTAGVCALSHDVYLGTDNPPTTLIADDILDSNCFPDTLDCSTLYHWRVDENTSAGTITGDVWSFTTIDGKATAPQPAHGASGVSLDADLSWTAGVCALSHDVWFGTDNPPTTLIADDILDTNCAPGTLDSATVYYWSVDENTAAGTLMGDVWSFRTEIWDIWVDDDYTASGENDGHTWGIDAFDNIGAGIDMAEYGITVHVAAGTYLENITLKNGVALIGAGADIAVIDGGGIGSVVTSTGCDANTILEGFTITGGYAGDGSGMYNNNSSPTVTKCSFSANNAVWAGGGMDNRNSSSPTVVDCTFSQNTAGTNGGGIENYNGSSPTVTNCTFSGNTAIKFGGGMYEKNSNPTVSYCNFTDNSAKEGGGMHNGSSSSPMVSDCTFSNNTANWGGGMYNHTSSPTVINCTFTGNNAITSVTTGYGGGMHNNWHSSPTVTNCIFNGNTTEIWGGGMYNYDHSWPRVTNCTFKANTAESGGAISNKNDSSPTVTNCILWSDSAGTSGDEIYNYSSSTPAISYSDITGCGGSGTGWNGSLGTDVGGNIDADPLFSASALNGFHLKSEFGRVTTDPSVPYGSWVVDTVTSPCIDAGDENMEVGNEPDGNGGRINMGRYGGTYQASKSSYVETIEGDVNGDGKVDFRDIAVVAGNWLAGTEPEL